MRQLRVHGPGDLRWDEVPDPQLIDERDAIVEPIAVARCDLDPAVASGIYTSSEPVAIGHEMAGRVVAVGKRAGSVQVGDMVIVPFQISCGLCAMCTAGVTNACATVPFASGYGLGTFGGQSFGGALADLVRVPFADHMLLPLPNGLDPIVAAGVPDNVSDGFRCVAGPLATYPGAEVLVQGGLAQSVGLYAVACAIGLDASEVVYADSDTARIAVARRLGATVIEIEPGDPLPASEFPIVVDASATGAGRTRALNATSPAGTCTCVSSSFDGDDTMPIRSLYMKGVRFEIARVNARSTAPKVLALMADGKLDPGAVITRTVSFDDAPTAMLDADIKIVFTR
jgi:threonine dehydrogenase-like Zn-dependent dehydrogenase